MVASLLAGRLQGAAAAAATAQAASSPAALTRHSVLSRTPRQRCRHAAAAAAAGSRQPALSGGSLGQPQAGKRPQVAALDSGATEAHKALNAQLCAAETPEQLLELVQQHLPEFNITNAVTAFHRIAKAAQKLPAQQQGALRSHAVVRRLVALLEPQVPAFSELHVSQLLWAHAHLGHASPALVAALYDRLETAEVASSGSGSSSNNSSGGSNQTAPAQPLVLSSMSASANLCYALAKLGRPPPACVRRLAVVLQAEAEAAEEAAEEASLQLEGQMAGWGLLDSAEDEEAAEAAERSGSSGSSSDGSSGTSQPTARSSGTDLQGISLGACDPRALCLLMWSLAELAACPPALLRHTMAALCRRHGLGRLSMQSIAHVLLAAQRLAAASSELQQGEEEEGQQQQQQQWGAPVLSGVQRERQRWQQRFRWEQSFMDAVAAELARRAKRAKHAQQGQRPPKPFLLNELDCSVLARAFAAAWQEAAAASGAATDNRLKLAGAIRRHVEASPARRVALRLLQQRSLELAPRLRVQALSALAQAFASIGSCPPDLLQAFAQRAIALGKRGWLDVQGVASLAWAYSTLQYDHPQLFDVLASAAVAMLRESPSRTTHSSGNGGSCSNRASGDAPSSTAAGFSREDFSAQAVSVLVFSFASANRCNSPAQRQMYGLLAERADEVLEQFTPQGLANLAWGLTVAACYPPQLMRRWRTLAGGRAVQFGPAELNQLHLVEVALRLEAPEIGLEAPAEAQSFFDSLYRAGRLRAFAGAGWAANQAGGPRSVTDFQRQVHEAVCALGVPCVLEHSQAGEYSIDVAIPSHKIAVEVDGPVHFATNSRHLMGGTALKRRLLQRLGWQAVAVPFYDWWRLSPAHRGPYMRSKLQEAGLQLEVSNNEPPALAAAQDSAVQQERQQGRQRRPKRRGNAQDTTQQQQLAAGQQQAETEVRPPLAEPAAAAAQQQPQAPRHPEQAQQAEKQPAAEPAGAQPAATEGAPPAGLAQRAQRLSMMQYRQGKLSKAGLLARGSLQAAAAGSKPAGGGTDNGDGSSGGDAGDGSQAAA
ncbi:FK506-binding 1 [Chlorella sorokiniana]|uniref:FK506-binding 1 n=1 Tax=Chlorella sorokiniana TaxID=3076 RepID=A0A2P6TGD0_CHLSO|nr:FK506-binding 1 [Chlorella sorokiniana]|eukprot:PRW33174.1 FK506-binding 1 [Chlorella sorokiniana]